LLPYAAPTACPISVTELGLNIDAEIGFAQSIFQNERRFLSELHQQHADPTDIVRIYCGQSKTVCEKN